MIPTNLLIADNKTGSLRALSDLLNWSVLGLDQCFTALSVRELQARIQKDTVDILLCGEGLTRQDDFELLKWLHRERLDISCVCLVSSLPDAGTDRPEGLVWLPAPHNAETLNRVLTAEIQKRTGRTNQGQLYHFLHANREMLCQQFWERLFYGEIPSLRSALAEAIDRFMLPLDLSWSYCPSLLMVRNWDQDLEDDHRVNRYGVHNVVAELFGECVEQTGVWGTVFPFGQHGQMVICGGSDPEVLKTCARQFAETYLKLEKRFLKVRAVCYLGQVVSMEQMAEEMEGLMQMDNTRLQNNGIAVHRSGVGTLPTEVELDPRFERWGNLLQGGLFAKAQQEILDYLTEQEKNPWFNKRRFRYFLERYAGMLNSYTERIKYPLRQLTADPADAQCFETSDRGLDYMRKWVACSLGHLARVSNSGDPIDATKRYIETHLSEELKVQEIADHVFLNPDYLTRIFKRETGVSIKSYIVNRRMEKARNLLETSELPIAEVACRMGYYNYTSFSRIFKKYYGISPQSLRREAE